MLREYAVFAESKDTGNRLLLHRGFASQEEAADHPVKLSLWKKVWVEEVTPSPPKRVGLPPRPWSLETSSEPSANGLFHAYIVDATGRKIAALWGSGDEKMRTAEIILAAANGAPAT